MHTFHIPVMGTGFTIDTPLKVAKYGISSVISVVDDFLIEQMRKFYAEKAGEPYETIERREKDARARRITLYLNLLHRLVERQMQKLKAEPFEPGSDITRYFELLPDAPPRQLYQKMLAENNPEEKAQLQERLRGLVIPGDINVNIMTKVDKDNTHEGELLPAEYADAMSALRGFGLSDLRSSIVFSAGMNMRLYTYLTQFEDFLPDADGVLGKKVALKVSDHRSAEIQGKFLAKRGIWVSEYRIESGLNCGGHAFPSTGFLMGPILEEFKKLKVELIEKVFPIYNKGLARNGRDPLTSPPDVKFTVQGGIGTHAEDQLMLKHYGMDATGWGTPFMLVPEATSVDRDHLEKLLAATEEDVFLSDASPLGIPFWNLRNSGSEIARRQRIEDGRPGSSCPKSYLTFNTELSKKPLCLASRAYQKRKLKSLRENGSTKAQQDVIEASVLAKSCICHDLAGSAQIKNEIVPDATPAVCCGPGILDFSKIASLEEMVGHIYGRLNLMTRPGRVHMFIRELTLYIEYLRKEMELYSLELCNRKESYFSEFKKNLQNGIEYYRRLAEIFFKEERSEFLESLKSLAQALEALELAPTPTPSK